MSRPFDYFIVCIVIVSKSAIRRQAWLLPSPSGQTLCSHPTPFARGSRPSPRSATRKHSPTNSERHSSDIRCFLPGGVLCARG